MAYLKRPEISIGTLLAVAFAFAHTPAVLAQNKHVLPLFISASHQTLQGFVRITNLSERAGTVTIHAIDDSGERFGPVTLSLDAEATRHFNSDDLRDGASEKGLSGSIEDGEGNWRLDLDTDLDIDPLAYTRPRGDGFLTSTHDVVAQDESMRWRVPIFNPGNNAEQHSWLRVVNTSDADARVAVRGLDDRGAPPPEGEVSFTLPAHAARMLSAKSLEEGSSEAEFEFDGSFGDGSGKWQLFVSADQPILVMSLLLSESGNLTNLSTSTASPTPTPTPTPSPVEQRMVPVSIDGQTVRLVVRIFRPDGDGPLPTLIFHHGSTGYGNQSLLFPRFWQPDTVIQYFVGRGWNVVLPSRRGRGGSEGGYDEGFGPDRSQGYSFDPAYSLPGADRALADIDAITDVIRAWPFVDANRMLIGGVSRGGILSVAHSGRRPGLYRGVLNFVGGWLGGRGTNQTTVNRNIFNRGVFFGKETLWLYASDDSFYSLDTTRSHFDAFVAAGGKGRFVDEFPGEIGHGLHLAAEHWGPVVDAYLERLRLPREPTSTAIRFTPDRSVSPAAFLGQWNGWWGSVGVGAYTSVTISSVTPRGEAIGTYTYDTGTPANIRDSVVDGVLQHRSSRSTANLELFVAGEDLLIGTYRIPKTIDRRHTYTRTILTRVRD